MAATRETRGSSDGRDLERTGRRLSHCGRFEIDRAPAQHVQFVWPRDDVAPDTPGVPVMFSGVIRNRSQIAQRVECRPTGSSLRADAAMLWDLYQLHGRDAFARIDGPFAVALYDASHDEVVLAADRWAAKPMYFARLDRCWAVATGYRALVSLLQLEARIDHQSVFNGMKHMPAHRALLQSVRPVAPGEVVRLSRITRETRVSLQTCAVYDPQSAGCAG